MKFMIRPLMIGLMVAAACLMPAAAQETTPIPPEATEIPIPPEATALPEGVVFAAPGACFISPDETNIAIWGDAVYDLPSGTKQFDLPQINLARYSSDGRFILVHESGLYDTQTGELLIPTENEVYYPSVAAFSPDGRLYVDANAVYDLTTLEQIATLNRATFQDGRDEPLYGFLEFVNAGRALFFQRFDNERVMWVKAYVDTQTWETILDGGDYPAGTDISFSGDFTRYAVGGEGVFSYPAGEKLFDLPEGQTVEFNTDSSVLLVTTFPTRRYGVVTMTYIDAASGQEINRFQVPSHSYGLLMSQGMLPEPTMTRTVLPITTQVGTGETADYRVRGWQAVEIATGEVVQKIEDSEELIVGDNINILREALGLPRNDRWDGDGYYVIQGEGIFDAETDTLIFAQENNQLSILPPETYIYAMRPFFVLGDNQFSVSRQGTYVYAVSPCTVWELP